MIFTPDSRFLIAGSWGADGRAVRQWDVATGKKVREFVGHGNAVQALAMSPDGRTLLTADSAIHVWDWQSGRERLSGGNAGGVSEMLSWRTARRSSPMAAATVCDDGMRSPAETSGGSPNRAGGCVRFQSPQAARRSW